MKLDMIGKAEKYLEAFEEIKNRTNGDEILARTVLQEAAKDRRMDEMREERRERNGEAATTKQLEYLKRLGVDYPPGITKKQASVLIDNALDGTDNE